MKDPKPTSKSESALPALVRTDPRLELFRLGLEPKLLPEPEPPSALDQLTK